jgi:molybdopterin synthase sulfur carrier subunit
MKIELRYFASIRETIGCAGESWQSQARTLGELRAELAARDGVYAQCLGHGRAVRTALDQVMSHDAAELTQDCEVAFFPPVTGG